MDPRCHHVELGSARSWRHKALKTDDYLGPRQIALLTFDRFAAAVAYGPITGAELHPPALAPLTRRSVERAP